MIVKLIQHVLWASSLISLLLVDHQSTPWWHLASIHLNSPLSWMRRTERCFRSWWDAMQTTRSLSSSGASWATLGCPKRSSALRTGSAWQLLLRAKVYHFSNVEVRKEFETKLRKRFPIVLLLPGTVNDRHLVEVMENMTVLNWLIKIMRWSLWSTFVGKSKYRCETDCVKWPCEVHTGSRSCWLHIVKARQHKLLMCVYFCFFDQVTTLGRSLFLYQNIKLRYWVRFDVWVKNMTVGCGY